MKIAVYLGSNVGKNPSFRQKTEELGQWIGENGHTLVYGGAKWGLMGILADTVLESDGKVIGVIPDFIADRGVAHPGVTQMMYTESMSQRKAKMIELADAYIAMPGGPGTLEEISEAVSLSRLGREEKPSMLYNIDGYYEDLRRMFIRMIDNGFLKPEEMERVHFVSDLEEISDILAEYQKQMQKTLH